MSRFKIYVQGTYSNQLFLMCFLYVFYFVVGNVPYNTNTIAGSTQTCDSEGIQVFPPKSLMTIHCFVCMCKNGQVECARNRCPDDETCYMLQEKPSDPQGCCKCTGCNYQGKYYASGREWHDPSDPCLVMTCKAGVVTESTVQCYTPCQDPIAPRKGECCPRCPGCRLNGQTYSSNKNITLLEDPCLKCSCHGGTMMCLKSACPVLQCPSSNIVHHPAECCPRCKGSREVFSPPKGGCLLGKMVRKAGETVLFDQCTFCSCMNSTSVCRRETCPPLNCPLERQFYTKHDACCPQCPLQHENKTVCQVGDKIFRNDETWQVNECKSCTCSRGQMHCSIEVCPHSSNVPCPPNMRLDKEPGACCPKCVEEDGVCTVFGDPHYRTFDGKFFSFQGSCKYQLTGDCVGQTFSIRVINDGRATKTSAWTKTVSIRMGKIKVNLGDKMRVKINGQRVLLPYIRDLVNVTKISYSVLVKTQLGLRVIWDGNSFLEVSVPTSYKGRLCGLCGNYNSEPRDDFTTRSGVVVYDSTTFATSWQVGGRKACQRPEPHRRLSCSSLPHRKMRDRLCKPLRSGTFVACHERLRPDIYFKSCLVDMCECPGRKCYCESLTAYAHECQRLGILLPDWRALTGCSMNNSRYY